MIVAYRTCRRRIYPLLLALLAVAVPACSGRPQTLSSPDLGGARVVVSPNYIASNDSTQVVISLATTAGGIIVGPSVSLTAGSCTVVPTAAIVDGKGRASFTLSQCGVGKVPIVVSLRDHDIILQLPVQGSLTVTGVATQLILKAPVSLVAGQPGSLTLAVLDASGRPVTTYAGSASLTSDDLQATGLGVVALTAGVGSVDNVVFRTAGKHQIAVHSGADASLTATQVNITVTAAGARQLQFSGQPSGGITGVVWPQQPTVSLLDAYGNTVTGGADAAVTVTLVLASGPGVLTGGLSARASAGVAGFAGAGLSINLQNPNSTLSASATVQAGTLSATSAPFAIQLAPANSYTWILNANQIASFSYDPSTTSFAANQVALSPSGVDDNQSKFNLGSATGVVWDPNVGFARLGQAGGCNALTTNCSGLDASWTPNYPNLILYAGLEGSGALGATAVLPSVGAALTSTTAANYSPAQVGAGLGPTTAGAAFGLQLPGNVPNSASFSFAGWVNYAGGGSGQRIFDFGQSASSYMYLSPKAASGKPRFAITTSGAAGEVAVEGPEVLPQGTWTHLALTLDGSQATLYLNGTAVGSVATTLTATSIAGGLNFFGVSKNASDPALNASLDELALFNTALTATAVRQLFDRQSATYAGSYLSRVFGPQSASSAYTDLGWTVTSPFGKALPSLLQNETRASYSALYSDTLSIGLLFSWHLDEPAAGTVTGGNDLLDDSGQGHSGKVTAGTVLYNRPGIQGRAAHFDGSTATAMVTSPTTISDPESFSYSLWFKTLTQSGGKLLGFGDQPSGNSGSYDRHLYMENNGSLTFGTYNFSTGVNIVSSFPGSFNDGLWHHAVCIFDLQTLNLYLDGRLVGRQFIGGTAQPFSGYWRIGGDNLGGWPASSGISNFYFAGDIDEVALWNRGLTPQEALQLYRRGANRLKYQVRLSALPDLSDNPSWLGPDGTAFTYFSERYTTSNPVSAGGNVLVAPPDMAFANFAPGLTLPVKPYLQYRMVLESDDQQMLCGYPTSTACSPEVQAVSVGPHSYAANAPVLQSKLGYPMHNLSGLNLTLGSSGCAAGIGLTLGLAATGPFYYYTGMTWAVANGTVANSNMAAQLTPAALSSFALQVGTGTVYFRAFLQSNGSTACSVAQLQLNGNP